MALGRLHPARHLRSFWTFVVAHRRTVAVDVAVLTGWALFLFLIAVVGRLPRTVLYLALVAGVVSYSLVARWRDADVDE